MPSKYVVRSFTEDSYYHVFNRGVEKRDIFLDDKDYHFFQAYLFIYLRPLKEVLKKYPDLPLRLYSKNLSEEVELIAYCLMPNHFHLLLKQKTKNGISKLMKQITNAYTLFFNQKYKRVGGLMQGRFKAVSVISDNLFVHLVRYIHLNPVSSELTQNPDNYSWSSYPDYLGKDTEFSCSKNEILSYFPSQEAMKSFHEDQIDYAKELHKIKNVIIEH
ncbi:MAG: transposase [Candidatus Daviesbacteria bacterium]|nr:transposase [Candidatus Daviesbacteria bacterium]